MKNENKREHNYLEGLIVEACRVKKGSMTRITIAHDDWCTLYSGKGDTCDCDPLILAEDCK